MSVAQAFYDNGFYVFRGLLKPSESREIAGRLRGDLPDKVGKSVPDAVNKHPWLADVLAKEELLGAVKQVGLKQPQFLQVADVQIDHNRDAWHRDSAVRVFGGADWDESVEPYRLVKAITYLEIDRAGLAVIPGTHRHVAKVPKDQADTFANALHIKPGQTVDEKTYGAAPDRRAFVEMEVGDVLVFDERLLHCGRRMNADGSDFSNEFVGFKTTLGFVYGDPSRHSWRFHSYFRYYRTELKYQPMAAQTLATLAAHGVLPDFYDKYICDHHPEEIANLQGK